MSFNRKLFEYVVDAAELYENQLETRSIIAQASDLEKLDIFDEPAPLLGTDAFQVVEQLHEIGTPNTTLSRSGRFFGFVIGGTLPVAQAANWLVTTWDQNAGLALLSPINAKCEIVAGNWIKEMLELPESSGFGFVSGSTMAGFTCLSAARARLYQNIGYDLKKSGIRGAPKIRFVISEDIHPTNLIALQYMGYGRDEFEFVPTDEQGRMIISEIPDLDAGSIIICQAGNINSGAFDRFEEICALAKEAGAWVHVDGAFGGWTKLSKTRAHFVDGMELADSWSIDCHKWLNVPYDSAVAFCRDEEALQMAFCLTASYLTESETRDPSHYTPELSRRARGPEIWAALKFLGREGFSKIIDDACDNALKFANGLRELGFDIKNEVTLNQIIVSLDDKKRQKDIVDKIQKGGKIWLGPTVWRGEECFRISICSAETTSDHIDFALAAVKEAIES